MEQSQDLAKTEGSLTNRVLISYLVVCAIAEAVLLFLFRGVALQNLATWRYFHPDREIPILSKISPVLPLFGLVIPSVLLLAALSFWIGKLTSARMAIHMLGLSMVATVLISVLTVFTSLLPSVNDGVIMIDQVERAKQR